MRLWERFVRSALPSWPGGMARPVGATFNGTQLSAYAPQFQFPEQASEALATDYPGYVAEGYYSNPVVHAVINVRANTFAQVEWKFQNLASRDLYGHPNLNILERPWSNGSSVELGMRMVQDVDIAGNCYLLRRGSMLERLRPDWVEIITIQGDGGRREVGGYLYWPNGQFNGDAMVLDVSEVAHWSPVPDPLRLAAGMTPLTSVAREVIGDTLMSAHKLKFFDNAATPAAVLTYPDALPPETREELKALFAAKYESWENAYKTAVLDRGASLEVVGSSMEQMSFATVQAAGENRIAAAFGVPSILVGLKEGLQAATYSNFGQATRRFVDYTMVPMWMSAATALGSVVTTPQAGSRLWFDFQQMPALRDNARDRADILASQAQTIRTLVDAGFDSNTVVDAVMSENLNELDHTGLFSVQLQEAGADPAPPPERSRRVERDDDGRIVRIVEGA